MTAALTATGWALAGLGLALLPGSAPARQRAAALSQRVGVDPSQRPSRRAVGRPGAAVIAMVAAGACVLTVLAAGVALGLAALASGATAAYLGVRAARSRTVQRQDRALLAAVRLVVAELSAGASAADALSAAADVAPHRRDVLTAAAERCRRGEPPDVAGGDLAPLGHAWRLAAVTGAPVAATIGRVADDLAARLDQRRAVAVAASGAQASALMLAALPVLGVVLGIAMGAHPFDVLFTTRAGNVLCLLGCCLDCAGVLWTARLTARALRP